MEPLPVTWSLLLAKAKNDGTSGKVSMMTGTSESGGSGELVIDTGTSKTGSGVVSIATGASDAGKRSG